LGVLREKKTLGEFFRKNSPPNKKVVGEEGDGYRSLLGLFDEVAATLRLAIFSLFANPACDRLLEGLIEISARGFARNRSTSRSFSLRASLASNADA
jgi:hypothetical protein